MLEALSVANGWKAVIFGNLVYVRGKVSGWLARSESLHCFFHISYDLLRGLKLASTHEHTCLDVRQPTCTLKRPEFRRKADSPNLLRWDLSLNWRLVFGHGIY